MTKKIKLPLVLKPNAGFPLIRIGGHGDGGYLVDKRIINSDLLSLGISGDWRFEKQWLNHNPRAKIGTFDGSIGGPFFFRKVFQSIFRVTKPSLLLRNIKVFYEYFSFLKSQTRFYKLYIGKSKNQKFISFNDAIKRSCLRRPYCVKIDIEGYEYEILDQIIENQSDISGLVIEFHKPIYNLTKVIKFVRDMDLNLANIHVNNCLPKTENLEIDPSIELSFTYKLATNETAEIPHNLEQPNDKKCPNINVIFGSEF